MKLDTYYIEYHVYEDNYCYCVYITADSKEEAISQFKQMEKDVKRIVKCELAYTRE